MDTAQEAVRREVVQHAAERLRHADSVRRPCQPVSDLIGDDLVTAYPVQHLVTELQLIGGAQMWGRKLLGLDNPSGGRRVVAGTLVDTMVVRDGVQVTGRELVQPRVAVRLTARLVRDISSGTETHEVEAAVGAIGAALEIADLRVSANEARATDIVADNAGAGLFMLGPDWAPREAVGPWRAQVLHDDRPTGDPAEASWKDALDRLAELADVVAEQGHPLRAGEMIVMDSFGPAAPLTGDGRYAAQVDGRVVAAIRFGAPAPAQASPEEAP